VTREFRAGKLTRAEWRALADDEVTVAEAAAQPWPVAHIRTVRYPLTGGGEGVWSDGAHVYDASEEPTPEGLRTLRWEETLRDLARCRHRRRGPVCSDRCAKSREHGARDHGDPTVPFLRGSCVYCHAALVDGCPDCGSMNARHAAWPP